MMSGGFRRHKQGSDSEDTHRDENTDNGQRPDRASGCVTSSIWNDHGYSNPMLDDEDDALGWADDDVEFLTDDMINIRG
jgi:hypothetical protein